MGQWEDLSRVGVRDWTLTRRVECREQEDKERNNTEMGVTCAIRGNEERESGTKQCPGHLRESEQEEGSPSVCIDRSNSGPGEPKTRLTREDRWQHCECLHKVDEPKPKRCKQCCLLRTTGLLEDSR